MGKETKQEKKKSASPNAGYRVFCSVLLLSYLFFFSSRLWLPDVRKEQHSGVGAASDSSAFVTLTLTGWAYNPGTGYMEARFSVAQNALAVTPEFNASAFEIHRPEQPLSAGIAYQSGSTLIIRVEHVPKEFEVLSLWIRDGSEERLLQEQGAQPGEPTAAGQRESGGEKSGANFKCDARRVPMDSALAPKSETGYQLLAVQEELEWTGRGIVQAEEAITENNRTAAKLQEEIAAIHGEQTYETGEEIKASEAVIQQKEKEVEALQAKNETLQATIREYREKINKLKQKLEAVQAKNKE